MAYVYEVEGTRTIESNDGHRVVELRHFKQVRMAKLLTASGSLELALGRPGQSLLGPLDEFSGLPGTRPIPAALLAEAVLAPGSQNVGDTAEAFVHIDRLSGVTVRLNYVDGVGVDSLTPIGCSLRLPDVEYLFRTPVLADCYIALAQATDSRRRRRVPASQFASFSDPSLRCAWTGNVLIDRMPLPGAQTTDPLLCWRISCDEGEMYRAGTESCRVGVPMQDGVIVCDVLSGHLAQVELSGSVNILVVPQGWFLFDEVFANIPTFETSYKCSTR
jgi:hypothetical protein